MGSQSAIRNPQSVIRNPQSVIRNPQSVIRNPHPQSALRNPVPVKSTMPEMFIHLKTTLSLLPSISSRHRDLRLDSACAFALLKKKSGIPG